MVHAKHTRAEADIQTSTNDAQILPVSLPDHAGAHDSSASSYHQRESKRLSSRRRRTALELEQAQAHTCFNLLKLFAYGHFLDGVYSTKDLEFTSAKPEMGKL